jgi:hypothetical protein
MAAERDGRAAVWLDLLETLTAARLPLVLLKNIESTLTGTGDLDVLVPAAAMDRLVQLVRCWATERAAGVVACRHIPDGPHIIVAIKGYPHAFVLDAKCRRTLFGGSIITYEDCAELTVAGPAGTLALRPGAEAAVKLLLYGLDRHLAVRTAVLARHRVSEQLAADPPGLALAARRLRAGQPNVDRLVRCANGETGSWPAGLLTIATLVGAGLRQPLVAGRRIGYKALLRRRCPAMRMVKFDRRRLPDDLDGWLERCARTHSEVWT